MKELDPFKSPRTRKIGGILFYLLLLVLLISEPFVHRHQEFDFSHLGFFAAFGFVACVFVIYGAKILRFFTKKREDYYDQ